MKRKTAIHIFLFILATSCCLKLPAQSYNFRQYTKEDGLASDGVYGAMQDRNGFIWFYTDRGLSKFDGYTFRNFNVKDDNLPSMDIWDLTETADGRIFIHTKSKRLCYIYEDEVRDIKTDGGVVLYIKDFFEGENGIWFHNINEGNVALSIIGDSLFRKKRNRLSLKMGENRFYFSPFLEKGKLLAYGPDSLFLFDEYSGTIEKKETYNPEWIKRLFPYGINWDILNYGGSPSILIDHENLFLSNKQGIGKWDRNQKKGKSIRFEDYLNFSYEEMHSNLLHSTPSSIQIALHPRSGFIEVDKDLNLLDTFSFRDFSYNRIFRDGEENYWVNTKDRGAYFLTKEARNSKNITTENDNRIVSMASDYKGQVVVGTSGGGLYHLQGGQLVPLVPRYSFGGNVNGLVMSKDGRLFAGAEEGSVIARLDKGNKFKGPKNIGELEYSYQDIELLKDLGYDLEAFVSRDPISNVKDFAWDESSQKLYSSSRVVVMAIDFTDMDKPSVIPFPLTDINTIACGPDGIVWAGGAAGLYRMEGRAAQPMAARGFPYDRKTMEMDVDRDGTVWAVTENYGMYGHFPALDTFFFVDLPSGYNANCVHVDREGILYIGTDQGALKVEVNRQRPREQTVRDVYTVNNGLISNDVNAISADSQYIYFGTNRGLTVVNKSSAFKNEAPPRLHITDIRINGKQKDVGGVFDLEHDQNELEISYVGLSYKSLGKINYYYQLEGADDTAQMTGNLTVRYPNLSPGTYTFRLRAQDVEGVESELSAPLVFKVAPPYWATWWFRLLCLAALAGLVYWVYLLRVRAIKKREEENTAINKRFAELELDALQSQMNPHFVFNALASIRYFIQKNSAQEAGDYLAKFAKLMRLFLESSKTNYVSLAEELKLLNLYISLEQLRFQDKFEASLDIDDKIDPVLTLVPTMLIQPFVENAINHGLFHKEEKGHLKIEMKEGAGGMLIVVVEDDGVGREKAGKLRKTSIKGYKSRGMQIVNERLEVLKKVEDYEITIDVEDLTHDDGTAKGTKVTLKIPPIE